MMEANIPILIKTDHELRLFAHRAQQGSYLAVDTEFLREKTYYPQLCLIQLGIEGLEVALDPFTVKDFSPLIELFKNQQIVKVFHACQQDLELIYQEFACLPRPVFDTQLAQSFLSCAYQIGYAPCVEHYCGEHLSKGESMTDWSLRPLSPEQMRYALDDVKYLPYIYQKQRAKLIELGRLSWLTPLFEELLCEENFVHDSRSSYLKLKRVSSLNRMQLAIAQEIAAWREQRAAQRNIPKRRVLSDETIIDLARRAPKSMQAFQRMRGMDNHNARDKEELFSLISAVMSRDPHSFPELLSRNNRFSKENESVADLMSSVVRIVSERQKIAMQHLATKEELLALALNPEKNSELTSGWKKELVGDLLMKLLQGKLGLTVSSGHIEFLM